MSEQQPTATARPVRPARRFAWAAAWLFVALVSGAALLLLFEPVVNLDLNGQRSEGMIATVPLIALAASVVLTVSAIRAIPAWRRYRSSVTVVGPPESGLAPKGIVPFTIMGIVTGLLSVAGAALLVVLITFSDPKPEGILLLVAWISLLTMASVQALDVAIRAHRAHRATPVGR